jgi:hypothetical protein
MGQGLPLGHPSPLRPTAVMLRKCRASGLVLPFVSGVSGLVIPATCLSSKIGLCKKFRCGGRLASPSEDGRRGGSACAGTTMPRVSMTPMLLMVAMLASCYGITSAMDGASLPSSPLSPTAIRTRGRRRATDRAHGDAIPVTASVHGVGVSCPSGRRLMKCVAGTHTPCAQRD